MVDLVRGLSDSSFWGLITLTALFALGAIVFVPRTLMCVAAGIVYGLWAVPFSLIGSTLGAVLGFGLARYVFRAPFERAALTRPKWRAMLRAVDEEGWRLVGLFRLGAPIPATVQNYVFGLTRIGIWPYILATLIGTLPQTILYVYLGAAGKMTLSGPSRLGNIAVMLVGAAIMLVVILRVTAKAKAALAESMAAPGQLAGPASLASRLAVKRS
ncbi:Uncharacterized membrane protein YdjX, TVP38/TMEM64 family, SNARE-associated domain [Rhizobiales bacterium GAS188]|nr:Uncharacterized membrane protein YdjX, TVP38/TMEM64 family, SNARE-associated domain [Rhizobiales bacterium GAS188]